ncbi:MAG: glycosyltransferase, partial [Oscillospiraceae bacterium]
LVSEFKPDLIHANMIGFDGKIGTMLKEKYNVPLFITTHGSDTSLEIENGKGEFIADICKKADGVVAVSTKLQNQLLQQDENLNIKVIHNGFDSSYAKPLEKMPHSLISVGNLKKQKNFDITIKAFHIIKKKYPDATLTIIGDGGVMESLLNLARELSLENSINFCGRQDNKNVLRQMATADVFLLPSTREGFGIVYLEAMASGCFTIGTKGEGIADIIENEKNGILVSAGDYEEIAEYISKAFDNNDYKCKIQNQGIICARKLTWEENARKNTEFFEKEIGYVSQKKVLQNT